MCDDWVNPPSDAGGNLDNKHPRAADSTQPPLSAPKPLAGARVGRAAPSDAATNDASPSSPARDVSAPPDDALTPSELFDAAGVDRRIALLRAQITSGRYLTRERLNVVVERLYRLLRGE